MKFVHEKKDTSKFVHQVVSINEKSERMKFVHEKKTERGEEMLNQVEPDKERMHFVKVKNLSRLFHQIELNEKKREEKKMKETEIIEAIKDLLTWEHFGSEHSIYMVYDPETQELYLSDKDQDDNPPYVFKMSEDDFFDFLWNEIFEKELMWEEFRNEYSYIITKRGEKEE